MCLIPKPRHPLGLQIDSYTFSGSFGFPTKFDPHQNNLSFLSSLLHTMKKRLLVVILAHRSNKCKVSRLGEYFRLPPCHFQLNLVHNKFIVIYSTFA
ncbi:hypothetical protein PanWU01x14_248120 [Parasponia andersonii]|uniref:Uncharacterized protein n=1 Tax=Parasponia andersonii TaxID=3476 RepID=A0A2P5BDW8_PARAD|nr:hypothetical protein PanWU01x14_248120 [Parasponia andersonii]